MPEQNSDITWLSLVIISKLEDLFRLSWTAGQPSGGRCSLVIIGGYRVDRCPCQIRSLARRSPRSPSTRTDMILREAFGPERELQTWAFLRAVSHLPERLASREPIHSQLGRLPVNESIEAYASQLEDPAVEWTGVTRSVHWP
ncbi:hypothetical protein BDW72DRAFT_90259 [Aspergillus terricola var. indicus]